MENEAGWRRVAEAVRRRRDDSGWTQLEVATRGPSIDRIQAIEGARTDRYSARTIAKLERALEWQSGSIRSILAGGDPTPIDNGNQPDLHAVPDADDERLDRLDEIADRLAVGLQEVRDELAELRRNRERDAGSHERHGVR